MYTKPTTVKGESEVSEADPSLNTNRNINLLAQIQYSISGGRKSFMGRLSCILLLAARYSRNTH